MWAIPRFGPTPIGYKPAGRKSGVSKSTWQRAGDHRQERRRQPMSGIEQPAQLPNGIVVGAIVAVNCVGNVIDPKTGRSLPALEPMDGKGFQDIIEGYSFRPGGIGVGPNLGIAHIEVKRTAAGTIGTTPVQP